MENQQYWKGFFLLFLDPGFLEEEMQSLLLHMEFKKKLRYMYISYLIKKNIIFIESGVEQEVLQQKCLNGWRIGKSTKKSKDLILRNFLKSLQNKP